MPNAKPYPVRSDKDADVDEGLDDAGIDELEQILEEALEQSPPPRVRSYRPGHRQPSAARVVELNVPSPWERPRDGFTASMTERVPVMRSTKQAGYVRGTTRES
jgi:hypothetical protein